MKNRFLRAAVLFALVALPVLVFWNLPAAAAPAGFDWSTGGSRARSCDFLNCPVGCCDNSGNCHEPPTDQYCGYFGGSCEACTGSTPYCFDEGAYAQCVGCSALTCPIGCCGGDGLCHENSPQYCGLAGGSCSTCTPPNQFCDAGFCVGCGAATCPVGCCDPSGNCHNPPTDQFCGYYGADCVACAVPTPYCFDEGVYSQCTACDAVTCPIGCCGSDGYCHNDQNAQYCGIAGVSCDTCTGSTPNCIAGFCVECDLATCPAGCCDTLNVCHNENDAQYCGIAATSCGACTGPTPNCDNGFCVGCSDIYPCADGCCDITSSLCYPGTDSSECGSVGGFCANCLNNSQFCQNAACTTCGPGSCTSGCCDSTGACVGGTAGDACGTGGIACANCILNGEDCVAQSCVSAPDDDDDDDNDDNDDSACGADNCAAGCCMNNQCWPGTTDAKCGAHAAACVNCQDKNEVCQNNVCVPPDDDASPTDDDTTDDDTTDDDNDTADDDDDESPVIHHGSSSPNSGCGC
jgi:hypothetical protein